MGELTTRDARRRVAAEPAADGRPPGNRYALVIGIDRYNPPLRRLYNAVKDATVIAGRLRDDFGFDVTLLTDGDATANAIDDVLLRWAADSKPEDSVLVFFAGHGDSRPAEDREKEGYLLPAGASDDPATWLPESEIVQRAKSLPARWVFLIFDACYAGTTFRHDIPTGARDDQVLKALVAGTEDQPVLDGGAGDHSIFTRAVLDGLDGWAEAGQQPDDVITADELIAYVKSEVPWRSRVRGREQTPVGGPLQGSRSGWDFEFIPIKPRLPAPLLRNIYSSNAEDRVAAAKQLAVVGPTDTAEVIQKKAAELILLLLDDPVIEVRVTAARCLGRLGHPDGCAPLADLLRSDAETSELRAAAAAALGDLGQTAGCQQTAVGVLLDALHMTEGKILEATKLGLGQIPESAPSLAAALEDAELSQREQIADALACLAVAHPDDDRAWPALDSLDVRLMRRSFMAARRLRPRWGDIGRRALAVGTGGALGLGIGHVIMIMGSDPFYPHGLAAFSFSLLPGALAGVSLVPGPQLVQALTRHSGRGAALLGPIIGGLLLGAGLSLPNWFLRIGPDRLAWFLPAFVSGLLLSLTLTRWPPASMSISRQGRLFTTFEAAKSYIGPIVITALVGGLSFALMRVPDAFAWGGEPRSAVVLRFGVGGAIFAAALAIGWSLAPVGRRNQ